MRRGLTLGLMAASLAGAPHAFATVMPCFWLTPKPLPAPVEPGEPALRVDVAGRTTAESVGFRLLDAQGNELEISTDADVEADGGSFFVRSTVRIEPGRYAIEYTHECVGAVHWDIEFVEAPPLPAELGQLSVEQHCPVDSKFHYTPLPVSVTLALDPAVIPYAPLVRFSLTDDLGHVHVRVPDLSRLPLDPVRLEIFPACGLTPSIALGERTLTLSAESIEGTSFPPLSQTLTVACLDCSKPATPGAPAPPDPSAPTRSKNPDQGCECRAVAVPSSLPPASFFVLLGIAGASRYRRLTRRK